MSSEPKTVPIPAVGPATVVSFSPRHPLKIETAARSDVGRKRKNNQDSYLVAELTKDVAVRGTNLPPSAFPFTKQSAFLLVVADGMGGHAGGEEASSTAIAEIEEYALHSLNWFFQAHGTEAETLKADLKEALEQADLKVRLRAREQPQLKGMGTTLTLGLLTQGQIFIAHVGDSRAYRLHDGILLRLTSDHTVSEELLRRGLINKEQAASHPYRHVVTNAIGGSKATPTVEVSHTFLEAGDQLLFCSDGLTEMLDDVKIGEILRKEPTAEAACEAFITKANEAGGRDNITALVARLARA